MEKIWGPYSHFLKDRKICICLKRKYNGYMVILPAMTYGSRSIWTLTKHQEKKLCSSPTKHGDIDVKHHEERQDPE